MSSLEILIACFPLALYFGKMGLLHFRPYPTLWNGVQDVLFLCFGMSGLFFVGPLKLLCPINIFAFWGLHAFALLLMIYILLSVLIAGKQGCKTVLYHISSVEFANICNDLVQEKQLELVGNTYKVLHNGVQFQIETEPFFETVILRPTSNRPSIEDWFAWEKVLRQFLRNRSVPRSFWGPTYCSLAIVLLILGLFL